MTESTEPKGERIAKRMADAGLCSRREAERWIVAGRVLVDGVKLTSPAVTVTDANQIVVDGELLPSRAKARLWCYHKPTGLVTTHRDPQGRPTVFENLPADLPRVISIGRLDLNSEGLLLLTNSGELARKLESPETGWKRRYRVRAHGRPLPASLEGLAKGVTVDGMRYGPIEATLERQQGANAWLAVGLHEGRNREVRKALESIGLKVNRLIRIAYGPFQLGNLAAGEVREVPNKIMRDQVGMIEKVPHKTRPGARKR